MRLLRTVHTRLTRGIHTIKPDFKHDKYTAVMQEYPDIGWHYILDPLKRKEIEFNIASRKSSANLTEVHEIYDRLSREGSGFDPKTLKDQLYALASSVPNVSHPDLISYGNEPRVLEYIGQKPDFTTFKAFDFDKIAKFMDLVATDNLGLTSTPRSYILKRELARMEQALVRYTIKKLLTNGFKLVTVPDLLYSDVIEACGMETEGKRNQIYKIETTDAKPVCLSGTAEMAFGGMLRDKVIPNHKLPLKFAAVSRCYRAEVSNTKDEASIYRVHNFTKVEMFGVAAPGKSEVLLDEFLQLQKQLFDGLGLHFQVLDMPMGELGNPAYRKYDIEAWFPSAEKYSEISSASDCTDYQSRRLNVKTDSGEYVCTVNGTACAVPRMIMALVENYQQREGFIKVPELLMPFMGGLSVIRKQRKKLNFEWNKSGRAYT